MKAQHKAMTIVAAAVLCAACAAQAVTIYVDAANTPPGTGTLADPYPAITNAVDALAASNALAQGGHTISVAAGTYAEAVTFLNSHSGGAAPNTLFAPTGGVTLTGSRLTVNDCSNLVVNGFTITGTDHAVYLTGVNPSAADNVVLSNCTMTGCSGYGVYIAQRYITGMQVQRSLIYGCGGGMFVTYNCLAAFNGSLLYNNAGYGVYTYQGATVRMTNCVIAANGNYGLYESHRQGGISANYCLLYANGSGNLSHSGHPPAGETASGIFETADEINSVVDPAYGIFNVSNIVANPGFAAVADGWDFSKLYSDSPCLGNGAGGVNIGPYQSPTLIAPSNATYYVSASAGDDARSAAAAQNPATPWASISNAATVAAAGDTVSVAAGVYADPVRVTKGGGSAPVRYVAQGAVTVDAGGADYGFHLDRVADVLIDGFTVIGADRGVYFANSCSSTVTRCTLRDNASRGASFDWSPRNAIEDSTICSNGHSGVRMEAACSGVRLERCRIHGGNQTYGVFASFAQQPTWIYNCNIHNHTTGVYGYNGGGSAFENCVLYGNTSYGAYASVGTGGNTLKNCIIANNGWGLYEAHNQGDFENLENNCFTNNTGNYLYAWYVSGVGGTEVYNTEEELNSRSDCTNNIVADPLFVGAAAGDFRLTDLSPCIDAGTTNVALTVDIFGNQRWQFDSVDIGSYEKQPPQGTLIVLR